MAHQCHHAGLFLSHIEMDVNTSGMGTLVINVYKRYDALLFKGAVQLKLFAKKMIQSFK